MKSLLFVCVLLFACASINAHDKKVVCYFGTWAGYRTGDGLFDVSHINPRICTHIIYSFIGASPDGSLKSLDPYMDNQKDGGCLKKFVGLRLQNPSVKLMVAAGGWTFGSATFSQIAANANCRRNFAQNVVTYCRNNNLDGFDLAWQYPGQRDGNVALDRINYSAMIIELKRALGGAGLLFSIAAAGPQFSVVKSYEIRTVAANVDFINVMAYDMHGAWDGCTGSPGALYAGPDQNRQLNCDSAINYWCAQGAPREKLIMGIPTYGKSYTLSNPSNYGIGASCSGPGTAGQWTKDGGTLGYNEICMNRWQRVWQPEQRVPYAYSGNQWVGYDDVESACGKANYINQNGLGGAMFSSLELDDFRGNCGQGKYPLISNVYLIIMNGQILVPVPPPAPVLVLVPVNPTVRYIPVQSGGRFICPYDGLHRDPTCCDKFYNCANGIATSQPCPAGLLFDVNLKVCNWPSAVQCY